MFLGRVTNISPEGMFIELPVDHPLKPDDTISISSTQQNQAQQRSILSAMIIHARSEGIGVMFNKSDLRLDQALS